MHEFKSNLENLIANSAKSIFFCSSHSLRWQTLFLQESTIPKPNRRCECACAYRVLVCECGQFFLFSLSLPFALTVAPFRSCMTNIFRMPSLCMHGFWYFASALRFAVYAHANVLVHFFLDKICALLPMSVAPAVGPPQCIIIINSFHLYECIYANANFQ